MDYMTWILVKYFIFSRTKIFLNERLRDKFSWKKKCWKCYTIVTYATECEKISNENGEIKSIYINESYIGIDYLRWWSIPAKLNKAHGEVAHMQIDRR